MKKYIAYSSVVVGIFFFLVGWFSVDFCLMFFETAVNIFLFITKLVILFHCILIKGGCGFQ